MPENSDSNSSGTPKERVIRAKGGAKAETQTLRAAVVREGLSELTEATIEILTDDLKTKPEDFLGHPMDIEMTTAKGGIRAIRGVCTAVEALGIHDKLSYFRIETRPRLWMLTLTQNNRIFQEKSAIEVISEVLNDHGLSDFDDATKESYPARTYCVQYRESDFDFISRLMEEEGVFYYFDHSGAKEKLVLVDSTASLKPMAETATLEFVEQEYMHAERAPHIYEWIQRERVNTGKISLVDYDFTKPSADLKVTTTIERGKHGHKSYEVYDTLGHYIEAGRGETLSRIRAEGAAHETNRAFAMGTSVNLASGTTLKLAKHDTVKDTIEFTVLSATHYIELRKPPRSLEIDEWFLESGLDFPGGPEMDYRCAIEVAPKSEPFRPPRVTPWPAISGLQTAIVTGPSGEEIHTDEHGRIKIQFHWDRQGKKDDKTTCWVRTVVPWSGKGWGIAAIPRIGQEVVIQFEEGDPDRPICTGMLYHGANKPPYGLPANKTQTGIKTNSSKGGGGFNELMFEDKKDSELVRFQSEKDYEQIIKNNADITIGLEKKDKGDLTQTIHGSKTETIKTGNHSFTVAAGNETVKIKKDRTKTIEGKSTETITGTTSLTVKTGDLSETIDKGNVKRTVKMGNHALETSLGNISVDAKAGKIAITAAVEILLKVGMSSIKIDNSGVTVSGLLIKVDGKAMAETKAPLVQVQGQAMTIVKGGLILLN